MEPKQQKVEDTFEFQIKRLENLIAERAPGKEFTYDNARTTIHFRITDPATGVELVPARGEWFPDELADKSDDQLWALIQQLSNGKL